MKADQWQFSISRHINFLNGYFDAAGRVLTSDTELVFLAARIIERNSDAETMLGGSLGGQIEVDDWSKEFGSLVENILRTHQRGRLGFYLIEYVCWFKEFSPQFRCYSVECATVVSSMLARAGYILELEGNQRVLLVASRSSNAGSTTRNDIDTR